MEEIAIPEILFDFYEDLPMKAPADERITRGILSLLTGLPAEPRVLDMGCGSGASSLVLARAGCHVTGVDIRQSYLDLMMRRAADEGLAERVGAWCGSMDAVPGPLAPVDIVWAEGSVFCIGFEEGLTAWRKLLGKGGYVVLSESSWFVDDPPAGAVSFWKAAYPGIRTVHEFWKTARSCGFSVMGVVILPDAAWDEYYAPQRERIALFRKKAKTPEDHAVLDQIAEEIRVWDAYRGTYGYAFYVLRKKEEG
jgi:cyclopropane fatty-acyl-phospholipid synthase-like methyltransferase